MTLEENKLLTDIKEAFLYNKLLNQHGVYQYFLFNGQISRAVINYNGE